MIQAALKNPYLVIVAALATLVLGVVSYQKIPAALLPMYNTPAVQIVTFYPGMPPEVMEKDIMSRLQRWTGQTVGIEHQEAKAMQGVCIVKDYFREDISMDTAMAQVTCYAMSDMFYLPLGTIPSTLMPFLMLSLSGCAKPAASGQPTSKVKVELVEITMRNLDDTVELSAEIESYQSAELVSRLEGYLGDVFVDIGSETKKGDLLAILRAPEITAEGARREKLLDKAKADRDSRLAELKQANSQLAEQQAMLTLRQAQLKTITSLVESGSLKQVKQDEAQYAVDSVLATINSHTADIAAAELDDGDLVVLGGIAGLSGREFTGVITRHAQSFQRGSRMMRAEVDLSNPVEPKINKRLLKPGAYGTVRLTLATFPGIAVAPVGAIGHGEDGDYMMIVDKENRCRRQLVDVIFITKVTVDDQEVEVAGAVGLQDDLAIGQRVIIANLDEFNDGDVLSTDIYSIVR